VIKCPTGWRPIPGLLPGSTLVNIRFPRGLERDGNLPGFGASRPRVNIPDAFKITLMVCRTGNGCGVGVSTLSQESRIQPVKLDCLRFHVWLRMNDGWDRHGVSCKLFLYI
jgi:hypothetical protein